MAETSLNVFLTLRDEASKEIQKFQSKLQQVDNTIRNVGMNFRKIGREMSYVGMTMAVAGGAITAPLMLAYKKAGEFSSQAHEQIVRLENDFTKLQVSIGTALIPTMEQFNNQIHRILGYWQSLGEEQQRHIVNLLFAAGKYLVFGGIALTILGKLLSTFANLALLISNILIPAIINIGNAFKLVMAGNPVGLIMIAIAGIIAAMWKWKAMGDMVLNGFQVLFLFFKNGIDAIVLGLQGLIDGIARVVAFIIGLAEKLKILPKSWRDSLKESREFVDGFRTEVEKGMEKTIGNIASNSSELTQIFVTQQGTWAKGFEKGKKTVGDFALGIKDAASGIGELGKLLKGVDTTFDKIKISGGTFLDGFRMAFTDLKGDMLFFVNMGKQSFQDMSNGIKASLQSVFVDALHGQLKKASDYFAAFGNKVIDIIANIITTWLTMKIITGIGGAIGSLGALGGGIQGGVGGTTTQTAQFGTTWSPSHFHQGGIVRAHSGLAIDEVPIIAQTGERVLSRSQNKEYEKGTKPGLTININPIMQLWDASDIQRNNRVMVSAISEAIINNQSIRRIIKEYA